MENEENLLIKKAHKFRNAWLALCQFGEGVGYKRKKSQEPMNLDKITYADMHKVQYILRKRYSFHPILSIVIMNLFMDAVEKKKNYPSYDNFNMSLHNAITELIIRDQYAKYYLYKRIRLLNLVTLNILIDVWWYSYYQNKCKPVPFELYIIYKKVKLKIVERDVFKDINLTIWEPSYSKYIDEHNNETHIHMLYNKCQQCRWYRTEPICNENLKKRVLCNICKEWRTEYIFNKTNIDELISTGIYYINPEPILHRRLI